MTETVANILVRKSMVVNAPASHVFTVFTERQDTWWPQAHHIGACAEFTAIVEPRVGGRWYERGKDGSECNWGRVLAWEPPKRLVMTWDISSEWKYDPSLATEVEIKFIAEGPERTRVELEHRKLEHYGDKAEMMRALFDGPEAWEGMLKLFAKAAVGKAA
jgi:uncharacterized protein YndB with AHSA1/START domain